MNEQWVYVFEVAKIIATILSGAVLVAFYNQLKNVFAGLEEPVRRKVNFAVAALLSFLVALAGAIVEEQITPGSFTPENISGMFLLLWFSTQAIYTQLVNREEETPETA